MKRLHTKNYRLTKRGKAISKLVEVFVKELVGKCRDIDPIDLRCVITESIEPELTRHYLDSVEFLDAKGRRRVPWRKNP